MCRRAEPADLDAIVALLADDALGQGREAPGSPAYADGVRRHRRRSEPAPRRRGRRRALSSARLQLTFIPGISHQGAWRGEIEGVRIASHLRGTGLGRQLLQWAIAQCRTRGCRLVQLTTNQARTDAQRFYAQLGFEQSHLGFKLTL